MKPEEDKPAAIVGGHQDENKGALVGLGTEVPFMAVLGSLVLGPKQLHTLLGHVVRAKANSSRRAAASELSSRRNSTRWRQDETTEAFHESAGNGKRPRIPNLSEQGTTSSAGSGQSFMPLFTAACTSWGLGAMIAEVEESLLRPAKSKAFALTQSEPFRLKHMTARQTSSSAKHLRL